MSYYFTIYKFLKIPVWDILKYFLTNFGSACIFIASFIAFMCCNFLFTLYHLYMKKDEENCSRLLNVFYGHYALTLQLSSLFVMIAVGFESFSEETIATAEDRGNHFACVVNRIRLLLVCMIVLEQIEISIATVLRQYKPTIYLRISLKWYPKLGFVILIFVSFIIFVILISVFDHNVLCSSLCVKKKLAKLASMILIVCCIVQIGVLVDCIWGWKTIKKGFMSKRIKFRNRVSPSAGISVVGHNNAEHFQLPVMNQIENTNKILYEKSLKKVKRKFFSTSSLRRSSNPNTPCWKQIFN